MSNPNQRPFSDELLSAYIDGDVTEEEKSQIESALIGDPDLAWQIESLRQTVQLLRTLPTLSAPRSFLITADQLEGGRAEDAGRTGSSAGSALPRYARQDSLWRRLRDFFTWGNLLLRNAAALTAVLFLTLTVGQPLLDGSSSPAMQQAMPAAAPAMLSMDPPEAVPQPAQIAVAESPESGEPVAHDDRAKVGSEAVADSQEEAGDDVSPMALGAFSEPLAAPEGDPGAGEAGEMAPAESRIRSILPPSDADPADTDAIDTDITDTDPAVNVPEALSAAQFGALEEDLAEGDLAEGDLAEDSLAVESLTTAADITQTAMAAPEIGRDGVGSGPSSAGDLEGDEVATLDLALPQIQPGEALADESASPVLLQDPDPRTGLAVESHGSVGSGGGYSLWQIGQWAALGLTALFLLFWLLSRRRNSPTHLS
jgi:anti-sigma factor RsiW